MQCSALYVQGLIEISNLAWPDGSSFPSFYNSMQIVLLFLLAESSLPDLQITAYINNSLLMVFSCL